MCDKVLDRNIYGKSLTSFSDDFKNIVGLNAIISIHSVPTCVFLSQKFNPFPNKPWLLRVCSISFLKTPWEKEKLLVMSNFSFSHSIFYPFWTTFFPFHQIQNCRLQTLSVWKSLKFVVWERVASVICVM